MNVIKQHYDDSYDRYYLLMKYIDEKVKESKGKDDLEDLLFNDMVNDEDIQAIDDEVRKTEPDIEWSIDTSNHIIRLNEPHSIYLYIKGEFFIFTSKYGVPLRLDKEGTILLDPLGIDWYSIPDDFIMFLKLSNTIPSIQDSISTWL